MSTPAPGRPIVIAALILGASIVGASLLLKTSIDRLTGQLETAATARPAPAAAGQLLQGRPVALGVAEVVHQVQLLQRPGAEEDPGEVAAGHADLGAAAEAQGVDQRRELVAVAQGRGGRGGS